MTERRGAYVTFDGGEGAGKSTQIDRFRSRLGVMTVREPGETAVGADIRQILLHGTETPTPEAEMFLFCADRHNTLHNVTLPTLAKGQSVLSDRSYLSTIAYQHYGSGLSLDFVKRVTELTLGDHYPDKQVIFDIKPEVAFGRLRGAAKDTQNDRFEKEAMQFHKQVRHGFLDMARELGSKALIIDASGTADEVHEQLSQELDELLTEGVPL